MIDPPTSGLLEFECRTRFPALLIASSLAWLSLHGNLHAAPPTCTGAAVSFSSDYSYFIGSAQFASPAGEAEAGSQFVWMTNGSALSSGPVAEDLLAHFDDNAVGANGETPATAQNLAFAPGKWGSALAMPAQGLLRFARTNNLHLDQGTVELWVALRADGTNSVYSTRNLVLFRYAAPNGDYLHIGQSGSEGILYVGGTVNGQWQSAYGSLGNVWAWTAGQWHHLAFTYSAAQNFMRFYVDGVLAAENNEGHYWPPSGAGTIFSIGDNPYTNAAHYLIDGFRISGRVTDAREINARARRLDPARPNEMWLATSNVAQGMTLAFQFTPATATQTGAPCSSAAIAWNGVPITNAEPPSTLLPLGATTVALRVDTADTTTCAYAVGQPLSFSQMTAFESGSGTRHHLVTISSLNPNPNVVNDVFVRCAAQPDYLLHLQYRALSDANPPYPRTGNLWGWWEWLPKGLPHLSKVDLWLGAAPSAAQILALRQLNPHLRILTSINAVENFGLPDDYYLKDINGNRIEVWPGSFRLNLTKSEVADYQARFAYQTVLDTGLMADGVFFDNVMTSQSWQRTDIYGNPVQIDADENGVPDDPTAFDAAWKAGVFREIQAFRQLMPNAITCGHSMDINEPGIAGLFNGLSIGFRTSDVLEKRMPYSALFASYNDWLRLAVHPTATMIESSPMQQISYGYDYSPWAKIPPATLEFARTYYPYVRFGLAFTLLNDGFFAHEYGDTWHGNDWWYDELNFNLGYPLGPAQRIDLGGPAVTNHVVNGSFEAPIIDPWRYWTAAGCAATFAQETGNAAAGNACARIDISQTTGADWQIEFAQHNRSLVQATSYDVTFRARSSTNRYLSVSSQKGSPDWRSYGLYQRLLITTQWQQYTVSFTASETVSDARLQFFCGETTGTVWLDDVRLTASTPEVYRRDFNNGIVLLNASREARDISVGAGLHRLNGAQAALYEMILDDQDPYFSATGSWTNAVYDSGIWKAAGPFYHGWAGSLHQRADGSGEARWQLPSLPDDTYTIFAWWPAAPQATNWTTQAAYQVVADGVVVASTNLDQTSTGDRWHEIGTVPLSGTNSTYVGVSTASGSCVADAIYLRSQARYNNGQTASMVHLQPMDGIILERDQTLLMPPRFAGISVATNSLVLTLTNLTPGITWTMERAAHLEGNAWQAIQSFQTLGYFTNLVDTLPANHANAFYRVRAN